MTDGYALQIAAIASVASAVAMISLWIGSRRLDKQLARLKDKESVEAAVGHPPQP